MFRDGVWRVDGGRCVSVQVVVRAVVIQAAVAFPGRRECSGKALGRSEGVLCYLEAGCLTCYLGEARRGKDCRKSRGWEEKLCKAAWVSEALPKATVQAWTIQASERSLAGDVYPKTKCREARCGGVGCG
jgi:hypothetical protein